MPPRIVIVGAGPGGAMLAYLLASRGVHVTLIDRQHDFEREFRGEVLMPSGMDVFHQAGLATAMDAVPMRALRRVRLFDRQRYVGAMELANFLGPDAAFLAVSQPAMLEMLIAEASRFDGFQFERGVAVRDLIIEDHRVTGVEVAERGQSRIISADLVIGADGRASLVRRKAGLEVIRRPQSFDIVWCKVPAFPRAFDGASVYLGNRHFALAFPTYDGRLQIAWVIRKGAIGELRSRGIELWVQEMAAHVDHDLAAHLRANLHDITHPFLLDVICDLMPQWTRPGLLLLGDAAHPMSPVGGQGINIALRDAVVAANHLVSALADGGDRDVLDQAAMSVQRDRMPEVQEIQRLQQVPPRVLFRSRIVTRTVLIALPTLGRMDIVRQGFASVLRRFAFGVNEVALRI